MRQVTERCLSLYGIKISCSNISFLVYLLLTNDPVSDTHSEARLSCACERSVIQLKLSRLEMLGSIVAVVVHAP
jgi:hypothetical protein